MNDNNDNTDGRDHAPIEDPDEARIDERARAAGSELRRPAPEGGLADVQRSRRNRQLTRAAIGGTAVLALVVGGIVAIANRDDEAEIAPVDSRTDTTVPQPVVSAEVTPAPDQTDASPVTVTTEPGSDTTEPAQIPGSTPPSTEVSDEVLPDPLAFAADGFERELVDQTIVVRSDPERVIPIEVPETSIWLYGVGPNGVAYLRVEQAPFTSARILAIPTSGATTGAVYELIPPFEFEGPWLGSMAPDGVDLGLVIDGLIAPYVDVDGNALEPPTDPTFTWSVEYRFDDDFEMATIVFIDETTGVEYEVPELEPTREGQFSGAMRPLPDGRVTVTVLRKDGTAVEWALTPATGVWTQHPVPS